MKNAKHYIVDKNTDEVVHGPYESEQIAKTAALHYDWFDPEQHEVAHGTHELQDNDDINDDFSHDVMDLDDPENHAVDSDDFDDATFMHGGNFNHDDETERFTPNNFDDVTDDHHTEDHSDAQEHGSHGHFIMHPSCDLPIAGPFDTEDQANEFKIIGVPANTIIVVGMLSSDGNFYKHD